MTPIHTDTLQNNISLEEAEKYTTNWRQANASSKLNAIGFIKAFNIPKDDIEQLTMLIPSNGGCRAYLGISYDTNPASIKLLLVPVNNLNEDVTSIEDGEISTIFDFTTPCPSQCASGVSKLSGQ